VAGSAAEAASGADLVITNVPDSPDVERAVMGPGGVLETLRPGSVVMDHSTISPAVSRRVAAAVEAQGSRFLDAPVTGGEVGAANGTLTIMVGGPAEAFERVRPVLAAEGKTIVHVSPENGAGQVVKLINNTLIATTLAAHAEALAFARKAGVDLDKTWQVLSSGLARSASGEAKWPRMVGGNFTPSFFLRFHEKDLSLALDASREADCALPLAALTAQLFRMGVAMGMGDLDNAAIAKVVAAINGLEEERP
jgi:2-hydroxy-3-oxopropionate reductase